MIRDLQKASGVLAGPRHTEALRIAEERFRLVMENVEDFAIFLLDLEGRVVDWNQGTERLLGFRTEEILGKPFGGFFTCDDQGTDLPACLLKEAAARGHAEDESWLVRKDESRFWASGVVTALRDEAGNLRGYVTILRDLTERKQLEEALRQRAETLAQVDQLKDSFLAMVSHQLRNPLGTILNGVQILRQADTKGPIAEQTLDMVEGQLKQVVRILDELLDLSRIKRGELPAHRAGPGQGREVEMAPAEEAGTSVQKAAVGGRPRRVLVLEDDKEAARSLSRLLRLWGHEVRVTYDGQAALEAADEFQPEVVLVDIGLPGMDGYEVARRLRSAFDRQLLLVAMTGFGQEQDRQRTQQAGFDHHLTKPADPKDLRRLLVESGPR